MSKAEVFLLIANAVGLGCYLFFCARLWADMPDGMLYADDGPSAISWFLEAFPFMAACAVLNFIVLVCAIRNVFVRKGWGLMAAWLVVVGAWVLTETYARSHIMG
jgi:hypothetical protein